MLVVVDPKHEAHAHRDDVVNQSRHAPAPLRPEPTSPAAPVTVEPTSPAAPVTPDSRTFTPALLVDCVDGGWWVNGSVR